MMRREPGDLFIPFTWQSQQMTQKLAPPGASEKGVKGAKVRKGEGKLLIYA